MKEREKKADEKYKAEMRQRAMGWYGEELLSACKAALSMLDGEGLENTPTGKRIADAIKHAEEGV